MLRNHIWLAWLDGGTVKTWTLEDAGARFSEIARRALAHHPQRVSLGDRDTVVVVNGADYAALRFASDLVEFIRRSTPAGGGEAALDRQPLGEAGRDGMDRVEDA
jgi:hypothetical protein